MVTWGREGETGREEGGSGALASDGALPSPSSRIPDGTVVSGDTGDVTSDCTHAPFLYPLLMEGRGTFRAFRESRLMSLAPARRLRRPGGELASSTSNHSILLPCPKLRTQSKPRHSLIADARGWQRDGK